MLGIIQLLLPGVTKILDKLIPDTDAREAAKEDIERLLLSKQADVEKAIFEAAKIQAEVNLKEAEHPSLFVAGWRPAIGWLGAVGLGYQFFAQPMLAWLSTSIGIPVPPILDVSTLVTLLGGMLGLGAMRTYEKSQEVDTTQIKKKAK
jgi:hypothetical protein